MKNKLLTVFGILTREKMKRKLLVGLAILLVLAGVTGTAEATLLTIGTATYTSARYTSYNQSLLATENVYNLIWDDDNNGNSVIWLDYTNGPLKWLQQNAWAAELDLFLTYNIDDAYNVVWDDDTWRLSSAGENPVYLYDAITSEMGHLAYIELGQSYPDRGTRCVTSAELNASNFDNLINSAYWSGTVYASNTANAWGFDIGTGGQYFAGKYDSGYFGLAIRNGDVSLVPVPEPSTIFLMGIGLLGLVAIKSRKQKS